MIILYLILVFASFLFYILYEGIFSFILFSFLVIVPFILFGIQVYISRKISVCMPNRMQMSTANSMIPVTIEIHNPTRIPVSNLLVKLEYRSRFDKKNNVTKINTPVFPSEVQNLTVKVSSIHYGTLSFSITDCYVYDFLKLFKFKIRNKNAYNLNKDATVIIYPEYIELDNPVADYSDYGLETDEYSKNKKGDDPSQIFDIHEYTDGDKISRIHWKLSAKQEKIMVKDYSLPLTDSVMLMIDFHNGNITDKTAEHYDAMIQAVVSLSKYLTECDVSHKACWYDYKTDNTIEMSVTDEDSHLDFINSLLQADIFDSCSADASDYFDIDRKICAHLLYFSTEYDTKTTLWLQENEISSISTYLYTKDISDTNNYCADENTLNIIAINTQSVASSVQDILI